MLSPSEAADLVEWAGSQRKAAEVAGVVQSTVHYWLNPAANRENHKRGAEARRKRYAADPEFREELLARNRDYYHAEDAVQRARRQLRMRRNKALLRRAERKQRSHHLGSL